MNYVLYLTIYIALLALHTNQKRFHAWAAQMQCYCVRRTFSRSIHSNCLGRGSNPYSPRYRSSSL